MFINSKLINRLSIFIIIAFTTWLIYISFYSFIFVKNHKININGEIYTNRVSTKPYIKELSGSLIIGCKNDICKVQQILDYVSNIEYKINPTIAKSPKDTIAFGYGDCDDKSNLLISLLKVQGYDVLLVAVPNHIFTVVHLDDNLLENTKGLYLDGKKYYILESTAKNSKIGFPFMYQIADIKAILEPFSNKEIEIKDIKYSW